MKDMTGERKNRSASVGWICFNARQSGRLLKKENQGRDPGSFLIRTL